jgi:hypothetical protein
MFKKILATVGGIMISTSSVLAADFNAVYATQTQQGPMAVEIQSAAGQVQGRVHVGGRVFPFVGREQNGVIQGSWELNGQAIPLQAQVTEQGMVIATAGATYQLPRYTGRQVQPQNNPEAVAQENYGRPQQPQVNMQGGGRIAAQSVAGQIFSIPVPQGWNRTESINETFAISQDGTMGIGFVGLEAIQPTTAAQFVGAICQLYKMQNVQVVSMQRTRYPDAADCVEAIITYTTPQGQPVKSWVRSAIFNFYGINCGYMQIASASPEKFDALAGDLKAMAEQIQIINPELAFDRNRRLANIKMVKNNPMDHNVLRRTPSRPAGGTNSGDDVSYRRSDVTRNTYEMTDPRTGEKIYVGQEAYDPTIGGVRNPNYPTETLDPAPHWRGRD